MRVTATMVTGASGEVGQALIKRLSDEGNQTIVSLDIRALPPDPTSRVVHVQGDILDQTLLDRLVSEYEFETIYHLAALLSTRAEFSPDAAHRVNVEGTMVLLHMAAQQSEWRGQPVRFLFPSSIAAFGLPDLATKANYARVREWEWNYPRR